MYYKKLAHLSFLLTISSGCVSISGDFDITPSVHLSATMGNLNEVKTYLKNGVDVNSVDNDRDTALMIATRWGYIDMA